MVNLTDEMIDALDNWTRTQPTLRNAFRYSPDNDADALGQRLAGAAPGSEEEVATLQKEYDFNTDGTVIYKGIAQPGVAQSTAGWRISRVTITAPDDDVQELFASNDSDFVHIWNNRASLSYSI